MGNGFWSLCVRVCLFVWVSVYFSLLLFLLRGYVLGSGICSSLPPSFVFWNCCASWWWWCLSAFYCSCCCCGGRACKAIYPSIHPSIDTSVRRSIRPHVSPRPIVMIVIVVVMPSPLPKRLSCRSLSLPSRLPTSPTPFLPFGLPSYLLFDDRYGKTGRRRKTDRQTNQSKPVVACSLVCSLA
ncbi:hypothetical protein IWX90DRAFT_81025 [Phyllosticta citrichinensis]|uniref:Uncharacterized protein n=1 Tax=Phyllosticta citrichinensis TaxID=1130410 RepID=A0ABR1XFW0_9PEZI